MATTILGSKPCPSVAGYTVQKGKNHKGNDIVPFFLGSVPARFTAAIAAKLGAACSTMCDCTGFNSDGDLKSKVKPAVAAAGYCLYTRTAP